MSLKKIPIITVVALVVLATGCQKPSVLTDDCAGSNKASWNGAGYQIPVCWTTSDTQNARVLTSPDGTEIVTLQLTAPEDPQEGVSLLELPLSSGETLYVIANDPEGPDIEDIVDRISALSFSVAPSSCEAPNADYPQSISYTWQKITFALPYCWGAEEGHSIAGRAELTLFRKDDGSNYTRVNFWSKDPLSEKYLKQSDATISDTAAEVYRLENPDSSQEESYVYVLASTPVWYVETNSPDDYDVQLILNSLTFNP